MTWYTLVCYRSDGADYCRGCEMGRSRSDFEIVESENPEDVAKKIVEKRLFDRDSDREYSGWDVTLLIDGQSEHYLDGPEEDLHNQVYALASSMWEKLVADEHEAKVKAEAAARIAAVEKSAQQAIDREKRELEEFKRLQEKYGAKA